MPSERPEAPFSRRLRLFLRSYRFPFSILILAVGILLTVLASGDLTPLNTVAPFPTINSATDTSGANYNLVFVFLGPIVSIIGGYLVGAYYLARRKFEHLMVTKSKAEFLRNIPELEDILWELTPADEVRYDRKKVDLKVRR
jgi:hypothetical protein